MEHYVMEQTWSNTAAIREYAPAAVSTLHAQTGGRIPGRGESRKAFLEEVQTTAYTLSVIMGERPSEARFAGKVAALRAAGKLSEWSVADAIAAVRTVKPTNRWAYFRTCLAQNIASQGGDLRQLLRTVRLPKRFDPSVPAIQPATFPLPEFKRP